jgi:hypothetical protein
MFVAPSGASLAIFADENSEPHASASVTGLAAFPIFHQSIAQFIVVARSHRNRLRRRASTIFWRDNQPSAIGPLLITSILVIAVAPRPRLALGRDDGAGGTTDDCTNCRTPAAA